MAHLDKQIHFIWVGSQQPMDQNKCEVIKNWRKTHPDYNIILWVDEISAKRSVANIDDIYRNLGFENIIVRDFSTIGTDVDVPINLQLKNITNFHKEVISIIRHEIDRMEPNYGCASDLMRYYILFCYGGAYFDIDIDPVTQELKQNKETMDKAAIQLLDKIFNKYNDEHILCVDCFSQTLNSRLTNDELRRAQDVENYFNMTEKENKNKKQFDTLFARVSNDMWISTQHNPIMQRILENVVINYNSKLKTVAERKGVSKNKAQVMYAYGGDNRMFCTIPLTGPDVVRETLFQLTGEPKMGQLTVFRKQNQLLVQPQPNALSWCRIKVKNFSLEDDPIASAIDACIQSMVFEAVRFNILRLDDHCHYLLNSIPPIKKNDDREKVIQLFYKKVVEHTAFKMPGLVIQNTMEFPYLQRQLLKYQQDQNTQNMNHGMFAEHLREKYTLDHLDGMLSMLFLELDFAQGRFNFGTLDDVDSRLLESYLNNVIRAASFIEAYPKEDLNKKRKVIWDKKIETFNFNIKKIDSFERSRSPVLSQLYKNHGDIPTSALCNFCRVNDSLIKKYTEAVALINLAYINSLNRVNTASDDETFDGLDNFFMENR